MSFLVLDIEVFEQVIPHWGTAVAEIKVASAETPKLPKTSLMYVWDSQNVALHAPLTARNFAYRIPGFPVHSISFSHNHLQTQPYVGHKN